MPSNWILTEGDTEHAVTIHQDDGQQAVVEVNGVTYTVDTHDLPDGRVAVTGVGPARTLRSFDDNRGTWISDGPTARCFEVMDERSRWLGALAGGTAGGDGAIKASMPGRVVKVLVAVGDEVEPGGVVAVLEAMKMENDIKAPGGGVVLEVAVEAGATVESGELLVRLEVTP